MFKQSFLAFVALSTLVSAAIYDNVNDLNTLDVDYVVIGGGVSGNVVGNRLTEDENVKVLILEAGPSHKGIENMEIATKCLTLSPNTAYDWNYSTVPQEALNGQSVGYARGHVLGGSSSINCVVYTRGSSEIYDKIADITGDDGFSWDNMQQYIRKNEHFVPSTVNNDTGMYDPDAHSYDGVNFISLPATRHQLDEVMLAGSAELGGEFAFNEDMNNGYMLGVGWTQSAIGDGARSSSAVSYLADDYVARPNFNVLTHAVATRILQTESQSDSPAFRTVEFTIDGGKTFLTANASREIIMAGGSFGTPNILLHSGIGPADDLKAIGIDSIVDSPYIGKNLQEHPSSHLTFKVTANDTQIALDHNPSLNEEELDQWRNNKTGFYATSPINNIVWVRIPEDAEMWSSYEDPSLASTSPHNELYIWNGAPFDALPDDDSYVSFGISVATAISTGELYINSTDVMAAPIIDPKFYSNMYDFESMKEAIRAAQRFAASEAFSGFAVSSLQEFSAISEDDNDELEEWIRSTSIPALHPVGTCKIGPTDDDTAVVTPDFLLKGVEGVRIVDASVLPFVPAAHSMALVYAMSERAADFVKGSQ